MQFSKFLQLDYNDTETSLDFDQGLNGRFKQILETSSLYAPNFSKLNDIDECRYNFKISQNFLEKIKQDFQEESDYNNLIEYIKNKISEKINSFYMQKQEKFICCFSRQNDKTRHKLKEDLLWAHYANGFRGVRINFEVEARYDKYLHEVEYKDSVGMFRDFQDLDRNMINIMTRKKFCWKYEQEYRAIFDKYVFEENRFPIIINEIILGKKLSQERIYCNENENKRFDEYENLKTIAEQIKEILRESNKYQSGIPKILAYKTMYSPKPKEI
ncbi:MULTISPECIES: hypothetical protein [unclassified Campylobacter]|nr:MULTISPECIES: hypothetical protein [unclassified Campylobacter]MDA3054563.1 hypothetical protein [Campylobacter sp. VBCF_07 NA4]WBR54518.1 hypothetical protein PF027_01220 [Campylobacter sp. VBCF_01 NA2]